MPPLTAAVVLGAGGGSRFAGAGRGPKMLAPLRGRPLVRWVLDAAVAAGIGPVWLVAGAVDLAGAAPPGVEIIACPDWGKGLAATLHAAADAAAGAGLAAIVVALGDQPGIRASAWTAVAAAEEAPIAVATYAGQRAHPVRLAAQVWPDLPRAGERGGRVVMEAHPEWVQEVACDGDPTDIDTVAELRQWRN